MTPHRLTDPDLVLLREAAEAGFHATPPTVLGLLDLIEEYRERWRSLVERTLDDTDTDVLRVGPWWRSGGRVYLGDDPWAPWEPRGSG